MGGIEVRALRMRSIGVRPTRNCLSRNQNSGDRAPKHGTGARSLELELLGKALMGVAGQMLLICIRTSAHQDHALLVPLILIWIHHQSPALRFLQMRLSSAEQIQSQLEVAGGRQHPLRQSSRLSRRRLYRPPLLHRNWRKSLIDFDEITQWPPGDAIFWHSVCGGIQTKTMAQKNSQRACFKCYRKRSTGSLLSE